MTMKNNLIIVFVLSYLSLIPAFAQNDIAIASDPYLENFKYQVAQISEFMARINGGTTATEKEDTLSREIALLSLFHKETYYRDSSLVWQFINKVREDSVQIHFEDTTWRAVATCSIVTNKNQEKNINLVLKTKKRGEYMYKWVIVDAFGEFLELTPQKSNPGLMISPADNEVNFLSLSGITKNESPNILNYVSDIKKVDCFTVFLTMVYNHIITIKTVSKIQYIFDDIAGYRLTVDKYSNTSKNAGWLISDIQSL